MTDPRAAVMRRDDPATVTEPDEKELSRFAVVTYRYLRLSIVAVLLGLGCSVVIERFHAACWEGSISAYFYTPVHSVFVGALVALGVGLIAIRGNIDLEDALMNVAGVLAPIVAFVPTSRPTVLCTTHPLAPGELAPFVNNNLLALMVSLVVSVGFAAVMVARGAGRATKGATPHEKPKPLTFLWIGLTALLLVIGIVWYLAFRSSFLNNAHGGGAALLFAIIGVVILINGWSKARRWYRPVYLTIAAAMVVTAVVIRLVIGPLNPDWRHQILWLEMLELALLLVFWGVQTFELWDAGVATGDEREERTDTARRALQRVTPGGRRSPAPADVPGGGG